MSNSKRNYQIDFLRGFAVFLVLWGHCIQYMSQGQFDFFENVIFRFIYSFHMPLFMAISGFLFYYSFNKYSFKNLILKSIRGLLYPLVICNCLFFLIYYRSSIIDFFNGVIGIKSIINIFYNNLGHFWFLWSVFFSSIGVVIACKLFKNRWFWGFLFIFIILTLLPEFLEFNKEMNIWMFPYFVSGFLYNKYNNKIKTNIKMIIGLISIPSFLILFNYFHYDVYIYNSFFTGLINTKGILYQNFINIIRFSIGFVGIIMIVFIINNLFKLKMFNNKITDFIAYLGKYSLQIYIVQTFIIECFVIGFLASNNILLFVTSNIYLFNFIYTPIFSILFSLLIMIMLFIMDKIHLSKLFFGR